MEAHQQRVVAEKTDLDEKIEKLKSFFDTEVFKGLDIAEQNRLTVQVAAMQLYSQVLGHRITAFTIS